MPLWWLSTQPALDRFELTPSEEAKALDAPDSPAPGQKDIHV